MSSFRRRLMMAASLPYDAEVEYLISTANAGISTGILIANDVTFDFEVELPAPSSGNMDFFGRFGDVSLGIRNSTGALTWAYGSQSPTGTSLPAGKYRFSNTQDANVLRVTGAASRTITATANTFTGTSAILYPYPAVGAIGTKWMPCKIYKAGVLVLDYICVRKGGVGYMYDRVSGELKGSVTANPFGYGPDKS